MNEPCFFRRLAGAVALASVIAGFSLCSAAAATPFKGRVVFLGDSITYGGEYIEYFETALRMSAQPQAFEILNLGLPSETVSGLSEPNHAGGAFPRPDLQERLERVLRMTKPDVVFACYGMNDGIYYPLSDDRFSKFQQGMRRLHDAVVKSGARIIHITPPVFDPVPIQARTLPSGLSEYPQPYAGYNEVLVHYSEWLVSMQPEGWEVADIHRALDDFMVSRRRSDPGFVFAKDGVHPSEIGHWLMTKHLLEHFGVTEFRRLDTPGQLESTEPHGVELFKLVAERQTLLKDAWLTETGHKRPGMAKGLPLAEAQQKAAELEKQVRAITVHLSLPEMRRDDRGQVQIFAPTNTIVRYTLDGTEPRQDSGQYLAEIYFPWKGVIKARAFAEHNTISSLTVSTNLEALANHPEPQPQSAILPITQNRDWRIYDWAERHHTIVELLKERHPQVLFLGDSITHFFGGDPKAPYRRGQDTWEKYYQKRNSLNLGFGWDRTENLLWRIQHGELDGVSPKLILILIGTNNLETNSADEIAAGITLVCEEIHKRCPNSKVILQALIPRSPHPDEKREKIAQVNARISKLEGKDGLTYVDIGSIFLQPDGTLPVELMCDFLHPTAKGYEIFAEAIEPTVARLLNEQPIPAKLHPGS